MIATGSLGGGHLVAAGTGLVTPVLAREAAAVVATDYADEMVAAIAATSARHTVCHPKPYIVATFRMGIENASPPVSSSSEMLAFFTFTAMSLCGLGFALFGGAFGRAFTSDAGALVTPRPA